MKFSRYFGQAFFLSFFSVTFLSSVFLYQDGFALTNDQANRNPHKKNAQSLLATTDKKSAKTDSGSTIQSIPSSISGVSQTNSKNTNHEISRVNLSPRVRRIDEGYLRLVKPGGTYFEELPSTTFELALLNERNNFPDQTLALGGYLEFDNQYWNTHGDVITGPNGTLPKKGYGIYTTTIDVDAMANINSWTTFFAKVEQENIDTPEAKMIFRKALVTFGNFDKSPFFLTAGKTFLPLGVFGGGGVWSVPMTRAVFRASEVPQVLLGYFKNGFNSNLSVFSNDSAADSQKLLDYVYSIYYTGAAPGGVGYKFGAGYLNDLRGLPSAIGSAYQSGGELSASKRVPAYDLNAEVSYFNIDLTAEFLSALRQGTYNNAVSNTGQIVVSPGQSQGVPSAWELGADYTHSWYGRPMYYSLSYSRTYHMAGIPMGWTSQPIPGPSAVNGIKFAWIASIARAITDNFILGAEWQRGYTYASRHGDAYTIDLSVYF